MQEINGTATRIATDLANPIYQDEEKAREYLEAQRWPNGPVCPHCGTDSQRVTRLKGSKHRPGLYQCNVCKGQFTVTVGTLYEGSHIPLRKWLLAIHLLGSSNSGVTTYRLHRLLGISSRSAWFMCQRIRGLAVRQRPTRNLPGVGKPAEIVESFVCAGE
jgi:transposase-like protein